MRQPVRPRSVPAPVVVTPTFVQAATGNSGASSVASQAVTITAATAGNLLVAVGNSDATLSTPTGFSVADSMVNTAGLYVWYKIAAGGETSVSTSPSVNDTVAMAVLEYSGIAASSPVDVTAHDSSVGSTVGPVTAGATASTAQAVELVIAATGPHSFADTTVPASPTWTNSYTNRATTASGHGTNSINVALFVAELVTSSAGAQSTSTSWTNSANDWGAVIVTFKGA